MGVFAQVTSTLVLVPVGGLPGPELRPVVLDAPGVVVAVAVGVVVVVVVVTVTVWPVATVVTVVAAPLDNVTVAIEVVPDLVVVEVNEMVPVPWLVFA